MAQRKCRICGAIFLGTGLLCRVCKKIKGVEFKLPPIEIPPNLKIDLIMTTMNQYSYTNKALISIKENTSYPFELSILDGASIDGTPIKVKEEHPWIKDVIELDRPYWIAYAWNRALEYGLEQGSDYIGILNNDILFTPNWLERVLYCFIEDPNVGFASPIFINETGNTDMGKNRFGYLQENISWVKVPVVPLTWIAGACFLLRREAILETGLFDENFFFGSDEVDYCVRLWLNGWKVVATRDAEIVHYKSITIGDMERRKSRARELKRDYGVTYRNPIDYFYQKWDPLILDAIMETIKPVQDAAEVKRGGTVRLC